MKTYNFEDWINYFQTHEKELLSIDWKDDYKLDDAEHRLIAESIRQFQKGESSEGKHLMRKARNFVKNEEDKTYPAALRLLILEEHRHSKELGKFMRMQGISIMKKHWVDDVFTGLRRFASMEISVAVLMVAEVFAAVYYPALKVVTKSKILRTICRQIEIDEDQHLSFQCSLLGKVHQGRSFLRNRAMLLGMRVLFYGTSLVVWGGHRQIFKKAGFNFWLYLTACEKEYARCMYRIQLASQRLQLIPLGSLGV